jgi:hypothetical protein
MMPRLVATALLFAGVLTGAQAYGQSSNVGALSLKHRWKKHSVRVCWGSQDHIPISAMSVMIKEYWEKNNEEFSDYLDGSPAVEQARAEYQGMQTIVESTIRSQFTVKNAGIEFTGWKSCYQENMKSIDAIVFLGWTQNIYKPKYSYGPILGIATLGSHAVGNDGASYPELKPAVYLRQHELSRLTELASASLHEFLHLAGVHHALPEEDARKSYITEDRAFALLHGFEEDAVMQPSLPSSLPSQLSRNEIRALNYLYKYLLP